ncbi:MAG TPA: 2-hydroxyacyl-CoA dehydratase family protein [Armatimonadota bacterium]|jgi:benzoyl-CoA reductase/2-hydroxyglutaryl-CoA dehydratase subunit BcrC/BadD/HgdB
MPEVGLTTTVPVEVILAAGAQPVDLNNVFINHPDPHRLLRDAEHAGYPRNCCGWVKGIYSAALERGIRRVIAVTQGDCSQTHAMMETLQIAGVEVIPFAFPYDRDRELLSDQIRRLQERFGVDDEQVATARAALRPLRELVAELDRLTWQEGKVTGAENHYYQVCCSDFEGDPAAFEARVRSFLEVARARPAAEPGIRLGFLGVPPIIQGLHDFLEERGGRVVFNEVPRQFTMADGLDDDLVGQYQRYTYPYDVFARLEDIREQCRRRQVAGLIHYTQAFCFRQIEDLIIKRGLDLPVLTIEGQDPAPVDARTRLRLEAFLEMLAGRR